MELNYLLISFVWVLKIKPAKFKFKFKFKFVTRITKLFKITNIYTLGIALGTGFDLNVIFSGPL
jgi:hypothetical protein